MKTITALALVPLVAGCHFDKLFSGGDRDPPRSHGTPVGLAFNAGPGPARAGQPLDPVLVAVVDSAGTPVAGADSAIRIVLGANPGSAKLTGTDTTHAVNGVATFADLHIDKPASGYTLKASAGLLAAESHSFDVMPPPTTTGDLTVTTSTTGASPDPDGYTVTVDGGPNQAIPATGSVTFSALASGNHTVALSGVAGNCTVSGGISHTATVPAGGTTTAPFSVDCPTPPPTTGTVAVTTSTSGASPDADGYTVTLDGGASQSIAINQTVTFTDVSVGSHTAVLSGIAANCTVTGGTSRTVNVTAGNTATASFSVSCPTPPPTTGDLTVTTTTGGSGGLDPDGYTVAVDGARQAITINGSVTFNGLSAGNHSVGLTGVATTCVVSGLNPRTVNVPAGGTQQTNFAITCTAPANLPPIAAFTPSCNQLDCSFTSTSSDPDGVITSQQWTFGDGATGSGVNPSHHYAAAGTRTVTLTVTDDRGATGVVSHDVTVTEPPPPPPNQPPVVTAGGNESVLVGLLYTLGGASFRDPDHDGPWSVTIDWGDGSSSPSTATSEGSIGGSHSYPVTLLGADYTLTVTVVDAHGARASASKTVHVTVL